MDFICPLEAGRHVEELLERFNSPKIEIETINRINLQFDIPQDACAIA